MTWCDYNRSRVINILTNPAYAGAYVYGRRRCRRAPDGHMERCKLKPEAWNVVIPDQFVGYVSWSEFQAIQTQLHSNAQGRPKAFGPPREGSALLQGCVMCGRCGSQMYVRYNSIHGQKPRARYVCVDQADARRAACQSTPAKDVDAAVASLVLELMTPMTVEMTLAIQSELDRRVAESEQHYRLRITRARYESDLARRRFMLVDPANRLVAAGLEADWNGRLAELATIEDELARFRADMQQQLSADMRKRIFALTSDLPLLWANPAVIDRERKEILALLIEDVTLLSEHTEITAHVRLRGGARRSLTLTRTSMQPRKRNPPDIVAKIDQLLEIGDDAFVAQELNAAGIRNWRNGPFTKSQITNVRKGRALRSHHARRTTDVRDSRRTCHALQRHPNNDPSLGNNRTDRAVLMRQTTSLVLPRAGWSRYRQRMRRPLCQAAANRSAVHLQLVRTRSSPMSTPRCALRCGALVGDRSGGAADRP
jgi:hypothetical protein